MEIIVLGPGCKKCRDLFKSANEAVKNLGVEAQVRKEEDIMKIMEYNIINTPGIVIDGKVVSSGQILTAYEVQQLIILNQS